MDGDGRSVRGRVLRLSIMLLVVSALNLAWWAAGLLAASIAVISLGVVERCVRHVASRKAMREQERDS